MRKRQLLLVFCLNLLFYSFFISSAGQTRKKFREHEVIRLSGDLKVEILNCKGEGDNEVCEVIYYTAQRSAGQRILESAKKIRGEEKRLRDSVIAELTKQALAVNEQIYKEKKALQVKKLGTTSTMAKIPADKSVSNITINTANFKSLNKKADSTVSPTSAIKLSTDTAPLVKRHFI